MGQDERSRGPVEEDEATLTPRQLEVLELVAKGLTNREIGGVLGIAPGTARVHVAAVLEALGVSNRTEATNRFHELGLGSAASAGPPRYPVPGPGERPALAVLPFDSFSTDPDVKYLADGLTEDLITRLARWRWFPVIARNSTFTYKDRAVDVTAVSRELGARYVVEGSVRPGPGRIRVTVQLIDGADGHHLWAQHYDRAADDLFAVQDEVVDTIVATLEPALLKIGGLRAVDQEAGSLDAWDRVQRAFVHMALNTASDFEVAARLADEAIALDAKLGPAYGAAFYCQFMLHLLSRQAGESTPVERLSETSEALRALDPQEPFAPTGIGLTQLARGEKEAALAALDSAVRLAPSMIYPIWTRALTLSSLGRADESVGAHRTLLDLAPEDPLLAMIRLTYGIALFLAGEAEASREQFELSIQLAPNLVFAHTMLGTERAFAGDIDEARRLFAHIAEADPAYDPLVPSFVLLPDWAHAQAPEILERVGWTRR